MLIVSAVCDVGAARRVVVKTTDVGDGGDNQIDQPVKSDPLLQLRVYHPLGRENQAFETFRESDRSRGKRCHGAPGVGSPEQVEDKSSGKEITCDVGHYGPNVAS